MKSAFRLKLGSSRYLGRTVEPISASSIAAAHWRPSRIAQTTSDWPRRMSPQAKTLDFEEAYFVVSASTLPRWIQRDAEFGREGRP